ncbi:hypothetical protein BDN70DRAFT_926827 [Pholiota conissans]|uniref:Protein kinase domain-containing protein n=1 Tax=Pholiota conissans TaxID=109636 RepID=A0A9P5ZDA1_9AGAR|nr:hypothetical protein BDN70DRAFT_926827 [Pholiota conissans]
MLQQKLTARIYLYKIFNKAIAPPPKWPRLTFPTVSLTPNPSNPPMHWMEAKQKKLPFCLRLLQDTLRSLHKRKISWSVEGSVNSNITPEEYMASLLRPISDIFEQLRKPDKLKTPLEYRPIIFGDSIYGGTFFANDFEEDQLAVPVILCMPDALLDSQGNVSSRVEYALSKVLQIQPSTPSIIVSNFGDIVVFFLPSRRQSQPAFERVSTTQPGLALQILATACLLRELHFTHSYINVPEVDVDIDLDLIGPPNDPRQPLLSDEEILATHHRNSDFDFITLIHDQARALQFVRWHDLIRKRLSKVVTHPGDTLSASTNETIMDVTQFHPVYPYDASELPLDTRARLTVIQRESPFVTAGIQELFNQSKSFTLTIQDIISEGSERGICTLYRCYLTSIDGQDLVSSPSICLKLFDDRFQSFQLPDEDELFRQDGYIATRLRFAAFAEMHALNEVFAYNKLSSAQGTVIPWFYGMHKFTLPDGIILYGLLMEYIEGGDLDSGFAKDLSPGRQIDFIRSCRDAVRVLDVADINQCDWHIGQILLHTTPDTSINHVVFIDLASTTQTWDPNTPNRLTNYSNVFSTLLDEESPFDRELVWENYGEPDDWDPVNMAQPRNPGCLTDFVGVRARDMFPYITIL